MELLFTYVLAPLVVAAIAGSLGMIFGLRKGRQEAAFERRLDWCERMLSCLNDAGATVIKAVKAEAKNEQDNSVPAEGRRHLGMKPLREGLVDPKDKFFAALSVPE